MLSERDYQDRIDQIHALRQQVADRLSGSLVSNPALAEEINGQIDDLVDAAVRADDEAADPPDLGLASLVGIGPEAAQRFGDTLTSQGVTPYDDNVNSERIVAVGDLYYLYQHEQIGVFKVVQKLKELFESGAVRLSSGPGAYRLYQFDRRDVLRYTRKDRWTPTGGCSATAAGSGRRRAARTPTSTCCSATSSTRSRCSGATSASRT